MNVVTARVEEETYKNLKYLMRVEQVDQAELVRRLLYKAVAEEKMKLALTKLREHKITIRKAAELAGVSYVEMFDKASQEDVDSGYSLDDLISFQKACVD